MVFYRKYRPQTIAELDLESVRARLASILRAKELPHAFLFTGPKGLGKTSSARILAKAINCEMKHESRSMNHGKTGKQNHDSKFMIHDTSIEPCNKCSACISITNGSNLDVIEIDAASNRGIDEIRDLREKIKFSPASLTWKVYIIDEVHMLTADAFNALLKTLEEPPSHAVFILCTTEADKVPPTIVSRTFHVQFQLPNEEEILHSLKRIISGEKLTVEEGVLREVFKLSEGSFRDAAKILEDLSFASENGKITKDLTEKIYKVRSIYANMQTLLTAVSQKDLKKALTTMDELSKNGADFKIVSERLALVLHEMIMGRSGLGKPEFDLEDMDTNELNLLLEKINDSYKNIKFSILPQIPLELVVVEWCLENGSMKHESRIKDEGKKELREEDMVERSGTAENDGLETTTQEPRQRRGSPEAAITKNHSDMFSENAIPDNFFISLLTLVKRDNHSIAGILRGCKLLEIKEGEVVFETKYKFHKDRLSDAKARSVLDKRASELLRENVQVVVNMVEK